MMTSAMSYFPGTDEEEDAEFIMSKLSEQEDDVVFILNWKINPESVIRSRARRYPTPTVLEYIDNGFMTMMTSFQDREGVYHIYRKDKAK